MSTEKRTSVSLFASDDVLLSGQILQLASRGVDISPNRYIRALAHVLTEDEILERARGQAKAVKAKPLAGDHHTVRRPIIYLLGEDVTKLKHVRLRLLAEQFRFGETEILRSLWYQPPPLPRLARLIADFLREFPDKRTQAGRAKAGRD
jgi:hypothetical protein